MSIGAIIMATCSEGVPNTKRWTRHDVDVIN